MLNNLNMKTKLKSEYIRRRYWFTVNDLVIRDSEEYKYDEIYPTLYRKVPSNYEKKLKNKRFDEKGVLLYQYDNGVYYNPIQIAQFGLEEYGFYRITGEDIHRERMNISINWLRDNQSSDGVWCLDFDFKHPGITNIIERPWISALAQGQAISLLCRDYVLTKDETDIDLAEKAYIPFEIPVEEGGLLAKTFRGGVWLEEYPTSPSSFTLNGFCYSIFGVYDLYCVTGIERYKKMYEACIQSVTEMLPFYDDAGGFSHYDLCNLTEPIQRPRTNSKYHVLHVILLQYLNSISPNKTFEFYIDKWKGL